MLSKKIPSIKIVVQLILSQIIWNLSFRHVNDECGIFLYFVHTYIAASPDFLISCSCCGDGCVEIKCPLITKCNTCSSFCTSQTSIYILLTSLENCHWKLIILILHKFKDRCMLLEENGVISLYILVTVLLLREYATMTHIFHIFLKAISTFSFLLYCQS